MRILIINYRFFISGGPERYMFNIINVLESKGHEVIPFSIKSDQNVKTQYEKYFVEPIGRQDVAYFDKGKVTPRFILDTVSRLFYSVYVKRKLKKFIRTFKPDVAYVLHHYNKLSPSIIDACKECNIPVYIRLSDFYLMCPQAHFLNHGATCELCLEKNLWQSVKGKCVKNSYLGSLLKATALYFHVKVFKIYNKVDGYVCTTNFMKSKMEIAGFKADSIHVIPTFSLSVTKKLDYKNVTPSEHENRYVLYFGRFTFEKGIDILVDAYLRSNLSQSGIKLYLVGGEKKELDRILDKNINLHLENRNIQIFHFLNHDKLSVLIKKSLFVTIPSRWYENMPNTVIESYSLGKPVIAMDIGSMPEFVIHNHTGYLFDRENSISLKERMEQLSFDDETRIKFSLNALNFHQLNMNAELHANNLIHLLKN